MSFDGHNWGTFGNAGFSAGRAYTFSTALNNQNQLLAAYDADGAFAYQFNLPVSNTYLNGNLTVNNLSCAHAGDGNFRISVFGGTPPYSFSWSGGNPSNTTSTGSNTGLAADVYTVTVHDFAGDSLVDTVVILQPPPLVASINLPFDTLCNGDSILTSANATGGVVPYTYTWLIDNNFYSNQQVYISRPGTIRLTVSDSNGCASNADTVTFICKPLDINNMKEDFAPQIFPNPSSGLVYVVSPELKIDEINVYDMKGSLLKDLGMQLTGTVDLSNVPNGVYVLECISLAGSTKFRIAKI
jgi:hypothetical protein